MAAAAAASPSTVEQRDLGARLAHSRAVARPMAPAPPVTAATWPAAAFLRLAELRLLERPVFHVEEVGLASDSKRPTASAPVTVAIAILGDVGGDRGVLGAASEAEEAEPRHQDHARQRVEHELRVAWPALWRAK